MRQREAKWSGARRASFVAAVLAPGLLLSSSVASARPGIVLQQPAEESVTVADLAADGAFAPGSAPTVSDDGRFVAHLADRAAITPGPDVVAGTTVIVRDRDDGAVYDAMPPVPGVRAGGVANPVLSGDGCTLVVHTEIGLDLFRDDDGGARWDLYRTVLPHCGGTVGEWDLISTQSDLSTIARDDLTPTQPAAVSSAGDVIAFTHPADDLLGVEGLTTVSIVDVTVAIGDVGRMQRTTGLPIDGPNSTFIHSGIDQPALSGDGRFVAFRSDAVSSEPVPSWGPGPADGERAVANVYVWDRNEPDPFIAVKSVAALGENAPPVRGSSEPRLSRNGRVVVFASDDPGLIAAAGASCAGQCVQQVFVVDRDVDGNNRFDESGRTSSTIVSASEVAGDIVAASSPAISPALSADGHIVAFVSKANNLSLLRQPAGGGANEGHLWVSTAGVLERIDVVGAAGDVVAGVHSRPQLDETGRTLVYDTLVAVAPVADDLAQAGATLDTEAADDAPEDADTDPGNDPGEGDGAAGGAPADDETPADPDSPAGPESGDSSGDDPNDSDAGQSDAGQGDAGQDDAGGDGSTDDDQSDGGSDDVDDGTPTVTDVPERSIGVATAAPELVMADVDFGTTIVGLESDEWYVTVINNGRASFQPATVESSNSRFAVNLERSTCVLGVSVAPAERCQIAVSFTPTGEGRAGATLTVAEAGPSAYSVVAEMTGGTGEPILRIDQSGVDFEPTPLGEASREVFIDVSNISPFVPTRIVEVRLRGADPTDFEVTSSSCADRPFNPRAHCTLGITFTPSNEGRRTALVEVVAEEGQYTSVIVAGDGALAPTLAVQPYDDSGEELVVALSGYPAESDVVIEVGTGSDGVTVTTDEDGNFFGVVPRPNSTAVGSQSVVAEVGGEAVVVTDIELPDDDVELIGIPGFGLG